MHVWAIYGHYMRAPTLKANTYYMNTAIKMLHVFQWSYATSQIMLLSPQAKGGNGAPQSDNLIQFRPWYCIQVSISESNKRVNLGSLFDHSFVNGFGKLSVSYQFILDEQVDLVGSNPNPTRSHPYLNLCMSVYYFLQISPSSNPMLFWHFLLFPGWTNVIWMPFGYFICIRFVALDPRCHEICVSKQV